MSGLPLRVLLVDDERDIRRIVARCLTVLAKMEVVEAGSCAEALACVTSFVPDLIVLDVMMPDQDGPATMAQLRALPPLARVPVIFLTAKCRQSDVDALVSLGAIGVIAKPFDPVALASQVTDLLARANSRISSTNMPTRGEPMK